MRMIETVMKNVYNISVARNFSPGAARCNLSNKNFLKIREKILT